MHKLKFCTVLGCVVGLHSPVWSETLGTVTLSSPTFSNWTLVYKKRLWIENVHKGYFYYPSLLICLFLTLFGLRNKYNTNICQKYWKLHGHYISRDLIWLAKVWIYQFWQYWLIYIEFAVCFNVFNRQNVNTTLIIYFVILNLIAYSYKNHFSVSVKYYNNY